MQASNYELRTTTAFNSNYELRITKFMNTMDGYSCKPKWRNPFVLLKLAGRTVAIVLLISHVLLANSMAFAEDPGYMSVCSDATKMPTVQMYDYIIVGGGTAGCPLAATLSQNFSTLLLERGGLGHTLPIAWREKGFIENILNTTPRDDPAQSFKSEDDIYSRFRVGGSPC